MRIDCHCHTIYSKHWFWGHDSLNKPRELIKVAIKKGLGGLAITDHNNVKGSLAVKKVARSFRGFKIITGSEIRTLEGEIIGLGIKKDVPEALSIEETIEKIHDLGGIAVAPHPFGGYIFRQCSRNKAVKADAIEVYNASLMKPANTKALKLANRFKKPKTAGSDAHGLREVGNGAIECSGDPIEAIMKKRVKILTKKTTIRDVSSLVTRKFIRSLEWRILRKRGKHV
ncbi:MAG: PHP domain-containing protein [Candidatus Aenigmatarchaeota archaeon]